MARPRTPTSVLDARGAFKANPQRARGDEPEVRAPIGNAPEHLSPEVAKVWREFVDQAPIDVLTGADRAWLEMAANLMAEYRECPPDFPAVKLARLQAALGHLGMNPSDRSKLGIQKPKPGDNPFANL